VLAVSHLVRDWLLSAHPGLDPARVGVVYNKPDLTRFYPPSAEQRLFARQRLAASHGFVLEHEGMESVLIGTASTNFELKGVAPLIRAFKPLPAHARLLVAGGRDPDAYQKLADSLGLGQRVHFCGRVDDMPAWYRALDIFILPTFYDACSNAVLEALASGCKVISSRDNGSAYFLDESALLDDPSDPKAMTDPLRLVMDQPRPPAFCWPEELPSGIEAFVAVVEKKLEEKRNSEGRARRPSLEPANGL
jgi:UDP-glucose:(heptosyl)LPS alpha-1,3-glucosyltransferase